MKKYVLRTRSYRIDDNRDLCDEVRQVLVGPDWLRLCDRAVAVDPLLGYSLRSFVEGRTGLGWTNGEAMADGRYAWATLDEVTEELP